MSSLIAGARTACGPIDLVVAWVDGADPVHAAARARFQDEAAELHPEASEDGRFIESGEIYFLLASVLKYAPFVRRVHIVTDRQTPRFADCFARDGFCAPDFINVVSHDAVFDGLAAARPNFNSLAIEAAMWRVPGLSEHFIYANDDFFLNGPVGPETFFRNGVPVLRGEFVRPDHRRLKIRLRRFLRRITGRPPNIRASFRVAQEKGARLAGVVEDFLHVTHHPHPLRRSTFERFYAAHPDVLTHQLGFRFRSLEQHLPVSLANHLELADPGTAVLGPAPLAYLRPRTRRRGRERHEIHLLRDESIPFGCVQNLELFTQAQRLDIMGQLVRKFATHMPADIARSLLRDVFATRAARKAAAPHAARPSFGASALSRA